MAEVQPMGAALQGMNGLENKTGFNPWGGLVGGALPLLMGAGIPGVGIGALLGGIFGNHFFGGSDDTIRSTEDSGGGGSNPQTGSPANPPESTGSDGHPGVGGAGNVTPPTPRPTTGDVNPLEAFGGAGPEINPPRQNIPGGQPGEASGLAMNVAPFPQNMPGRHPVTDPDNPSPISNPAREQGPPMPPGGGRGGAPLGMVPPGGGPGVQGPDASALMPGGPGPGTMLPSGGIPPGIQNGSGIGGLLQQLFGSNSGPGMRATMQPGIQPGMPGLPPVIAP